MPGGPAPGFQGIVPDTIEALAGAGELGDAASLLAELANRYTDPVTAAATARCRGVLAAAAGGRLEDAVAELTSALDLQDQMTRQPVEQGRTLFMASAPCNGGSSNVVWPARRSVRRLECSRARRPRCGRPGPGGRN